MPTPNKSTIVRARKSTALVLTRAAFRTFELVAPGLAGRWASRLWCTSPAPRRARPRIGDPLARPGERFMVPLAAAPQWATRPVRRPRRGKQFAVPVIGRAMAVAETWGDGPTTTYLLHGWGGHRGQLAGLVEPLVAAGQRVVALDAPGHGESGAGRMGGRRTTALEFAEALSAVAAVTGPAHAVVAHSLGSIGAALAIRGGLVTDRMVFVAPMASPMPYLDQFAHVLGLGRRTRAALVRELERVVGRDLTDFNVPAIAGQASELPPLLVIHDRRDREVSDAEGRAIAQAWPGASLLTTEGLGHRRILADLDVIDATVGFVTGAPSSGVPTATAAGSTRGS